MDCMTFVYGTPMFCLYKTTHKDDLYNTLRRVCKKENFIQKRYKNKDFFSFSTFYYDFSKN